VEQPEREGRVVAADRLAGTLDGDVRGDDQRGGGLGEHLGEQQVDPAAGDTGVEHDGVRPRVGDLFVGLGDAVAQVAAGADPDPDVAEVGDRERGGGGPVFEVFEPEGATGRGAVHGGSAPGCGPAGRLVATGQ